MIGEAAVERGLSGGILAVAGLNHVPHDALVDDRRIDAGAADGLTDDVRTEVGSAQIFQRPQEFTARRADGRNDD